MDSTEPEGAFSTPFKKFSFDFILPSAVRFDMGALNSLIVVLNYSKCMKSLTMHEAFQEPSPLKLVQNHY
ncbi:MAG TPA: hypothetical protein VFI70_00965 [Nitrososphaeraceae archaeon]|nr:hypothetical protein [Nitrososphaeraceae archaeon]